MASGYFAGFMTESPEVVESDDAADGATCVLSDNRANNIQFWIGLGGRYDERRTEAPIAKVDGDAGFGSERNALSSERSKLWRAGTFFKENIAWVLG